MSSNDTSRLIEAKKNVKNSIVITGIYVVTVASYNLVRDPSFVENNVIPPAIPNENINFFTFILTPPSLPLINRQFIAMY